jgi:hypothetical protein
MVLVPNLTSGHVDMLGICQKVDLHNLLLTCDRSCKKGIFKVFCVSAGNILKYGKDRLFGHILLAKSGDLHPR